MQTGRVVQHGAKKYNFVEFNVKLPAFLFVLLLFLFFILFFFFLQQFDSDNKQLIEQRGGVAFRSSEKGAWDTWRRVS